MTCAQTWHLWRCDGCGKTEKVEHGEWAEAELPARWYQVFGYDIHACSAKCRNELQKRQIEGGKRYLWENAKERRWPEMKRNAGVMTR